MRIIAIKQLRNDLCKELKDLPFGISFKGNQVATVVATDVVATDQVSTEIQVQVATLDLSNFIDTPAWYKESCEKSKIKKLNNKSDGNR